ncbi:MAG: hypothetical protein ACI8VT_004532 [Saprospiraceae bacterium]|jgi:hypothetical protein
MLILWDCRLIWCIRKWGECRFWILDFLPTTNCGDCLLNTLAFIKIGEIYNFLYFSATDYMDLHRLFLNNHQ